MKPIRLISVPMTALHLQHHTDRPIEFLLKREDGRVDRTILNSPHYRLLKAYDTQGMEWLRRNYRDTAYYQIYSYYDRIGRKKNLYKDNAWIMVRYDDEGIWRKILRLIDLYQSVKREGYANSVYGKNRVSVLEVPFSVGRFGIEMSWEPYEIWGGHHRAASLAAAGKSEIEAVLIKDMKAKFLPHHYPHHRLSPQQDSQPV
jgi:hypothetical protein